MRFPVPLRCHRFLFPARSFDPGAFSSPPATPVDNSRQFGFPIIPDLFQISTQYSLSFFLFLSSVSILPAYFDLPSRTSLKIIIPNAKLYSTYISKHTLFSVITVPFWYQFSLLPEISYLFVSITRELDDSGISSQKRLDVCEDGV